METELTRVIAWAPWATPVQLAWSFVAAMAVILSQVQSSVLKPAQVSAM
jgi:hypothetical protein